MELIIYRGPKGLHSHLILSPPFSIWWVCRPLEGGEGTRGGGGVERGPCQCQEGKECA